jgi:hypothetical protein
MAIWTSDQVQVHLHRQKEENDVHGHRLEGVPGTDEPFV